MLVCEYIRWYRNSIHWNKWLHPAMAYSLKASISHFVYSFCTQFHHFAVSLFDWTCS